MVDSKMDPQRNRDDSKDYQENAETNPSCPACVRGMHDGLYEIPVSVQGQTMTTLLESKIMWDIPLSRVFLNLYCLSVNGGDGLLLLDHECGHLNRIVNLHLCCTVNTHVIK
jgi:hypothetical protein